MRSLRFTIYELLGFIAPGVVVSLAFCIFYWAAFYPDLPLVGRSYSFSKEQWAAVIFVSYAMGHLIQGLCNFHPAPEKGSASGAKYAAQLENTRTSLEKKYEVDLSKYSLSQVTSLCQTLIVNTGKTDEHEVYVYREGFYKGSSAAYLLLATVLCFRCFHGKTSLTLDSKTYLISTGAMITTVLIALSIAIIFYKRYLRFANYRIQNLLNFACMPDGKPEATMQKSPSAEESNLED